MDELPWDCERRRCTGVVFLEKRDAASWWCKLRSSDDDNALKETVLPLRLEDTDDASGGSGLLWVST